MCLVVYFKERGPPVWPILSFSSDLALLIDSVSAFHCSVTLKTQCLSVLSIDQEACIKETAGSSCSQLQVMTGLPIE